jgi:hypothetical protein
LFASLGFTAFDDMITVTIRASHGNEYHGLSPDQGWPQHGIVPGESTDLQHYPLLIKFLFSRFSSLNANEE